MTGIEALMYYVLWMFALVLFYGTYRVPLSLTGKKPMNHWEREKPVDDPGIVVRARHAHANCVENIALFAVVVLAAAVLGRSAVVDGLACYVLGARVAQSVVHLIGTPPILVWIRASLFFVQVGLIAYMAWQLLHPVAA